MLFIYQSISFDEIHASIIIKSKMEFHWCFTSGTKQLDNNQKEQKVVNYERDEFFA